MPMCEIRLACILFRSTLAASSKPPGKRSLDKEHCHARKMLGYSDVIVILHEHLLRFSLQ
jgi:hypothetical protein